MGKKITSLHIQSLLPKRPKNSHKGTFGRVIVIAGSDEFAGAAYLAGASAYRIGCGLVTMVIPKTIHAPLIKMLPEATFILFDEKMSISKKLIGAIKDSQSLLIGPGLKPSQKISNFIQKTLKTKKPAPLPLVLDATALTLLSKIKNWPNLLPKNTILTPHPGEMARLTKLDTKKIQSDRENTTLKFSKKWDQIVVLKGANTIIASPDGKMRVLPFATSALATAGTGDVLSGAIAGLLAQDLNPFGAAITGAYIHGLAGKLAAKDLGTSAAVMAKDVLKKIPNALTLLSHS